MSDTQLVVVLAVGPVTTLMVVMFGVFLNNARMNSLEASFRDLLGAQTRVVESEVKALESRIDKNHSEMLHRFEDLDSRMSRIETHFKLN